MEKSDKSAVSASILAGTTGMMAGMAAEAELMQRANIDMQPPQKKSCIPARERKKRKKKNKIARQSRKKNRGR